MPASPVTGWLAAENGFLKSDTAVESLTFKEKWSAW